MFCPLQNHVTASFLVSLTENRCSFLAARRRRRAALAKAGHGPGAASAEQEPRGAAGRFAGLETGRACVAAARVTATGRARGTGKSTRLRARYPDAAWIDLLDAATEHNYYSRPERLIEFLAVQAGSGTVVIDEIQRVPELLPLAHRRIDLWPNDDQS